MRTCFLFAGHLTVESCLALSLDEQGQIDAPLETRTVEAIQVLQANARTVVVLPTEHSSLHRVELPWLSASKARAALTYALEEYVAQSVTTLHVAFDQQHYQNQHYLVAVIDKAFLKDLMTRLDEASLSFDTIVLDWFALQENEAFVSETSLLVRDDAFKGALSTVPVEMYLASRTRQTTIFLFDDSAPALKSIMTSVDSATQCEGSLYTWIAQRLFKVRALNLCQGELQHNTQQHNPVRWYQVIAALAALWLVSFIAINGIMSYQLTKKIAVLDQKIAVIYREFFPEARQVISPEFRVKQLLKKGNSSQEHTLWQLLNVLASIKTNDITMEQFRYQNQVLSVNLLARDFAVLEGLQLHLQQAGVKVTQTNASSHEQQVAATLELRL